MDTTLKYVLASQSPRRQELLTKAGYQFEVRSSQVDETYPSEMMLETVPVFLAQKKAKAFETALNDNELLITADTIVVLKREILGKPKNSTEAKTMLQRLSATYHDVITGVNLKFRSLEHSFSEVTRVYFRKLTEDDINHYLNTETPLDRAGAYGIQDWIGLIGVEKIEGCFYNVMGLPVSRLNQEIARFKNSIE